jgi:hypothetical protein
MYKTLMVLKYYRRNSQKGLAVALALSIAPMPANAFGSGGFGHWGGGGFGGGAFRGPRLSPIAPVGPRMSFPMQPIHPNYGYGVPRLVFRAPHYYPRYPYGYGYGGYGYQPNYPVIQEVYPPPAPPPPPVIISSGPKSVVPPASSATPSTTPSQGQQTETKPFSCVRNHTLKLNGDEAGQKSDVGCISP